MSVVDRSPARLSSVLGIAFGTIVLLLLVSSGITPVVGPGLFGLGAVVLGLRRRSRLLLTIGVGGLIVGIVVVGLLGARPVPLLVATIAVVLTWDASENAITVGERLGRAAQTWPIEIVRVVGTTVVAVLIAGFATLVFQLSINSASPVALVVLLLAGVVLTIGLRN